MKIKTLLLVLSTLPLLIYGQSVEPSCVSCINNQVDIKKGASAVGKENKSLGINSFAAGYLNEAMGDYSVALPVFAKANGDRSLAFGYNSVANGMGSVALGTHSGVGNNGILSIAIGSYVSSEIKHSIVLGFGHTSAILINDVEKSLMVSFNSNKPTFFVGPASGVDKTGKVGIGNITSPTAKLHIKADDNEHASLKLEPTGTNKQALISLGNNGHELSALANGDLKFKTQTGKGFFFENGKVITTGLQISTGAGNGKMLQSDNSGNATWADPAWVAANGNIHRLNGNVGIGTTETSGYKLAVAGEIIAEEVVVELVGTWPDYVFDETYCLMGLTELKEFIQENRHLPDIPKAEEVAAKGIELGSMNAILLKKIEELTLYILEQEERIQRLEER